MKYNYTVKIDGKFYPAGTDIKGYSQQEIEPANDGKGGGGLEETPPENENKEQPEDTPPESKTKGAVAKRKTKKESGEEL